jgi:PAS domain S-box-containing protein
MKQSDIEECKEKTAKLESVIENTDRLIWAIDTKYNLTVFNSIFKDHMKNTYDITAEIGMNLLSFVNNDSEWKSWYDRALNGEKFIIERKRKSVQDPLYSEVSFNPITLNRKITGVSIYLKDITERKLIELKLQESEERFRSAFEYAPIGMSLVSLDGNWMKVNKSLCKMLGYSEEELLNTNFKKITYPDDLEEDLNNVDKLISGQVTHFHMEKRYFHKNNNLIWALLSVSLVNDEKGKPIYFVAQIKDITEKKEIESKLILKTKELERSNYELEQFAYFTSHDLQEPLRTINRYASLLKNQCEGVNGNPLTDKIVASCNKMKNFISSLLIYSQVAKVTKLEMIDTNIIVENVIESLKALIDETSTSINYVPLPDIMFNSIKMEQIFQNIIVNSIKYRKKDVNPEIKIAYSEDNLFWIFSIKDNGIGIQKEFHEKIFDIFKRLHSKSEYDGNGVGLAVCKKIIEQYGGKIWVESEENKGSCFYFILPKKYVK